MSDLTKAANDKAAERALRESEGKLRSLFENLPDLIVVVDRNAKILFANRTQPASSPNSLLGACGFTLITPEYQAICRRILDQTIATGLPQTIELQIVLGSWWSCRIVPLVEENGIEHVMVICTDITQKRLAVEGVKKEQQLLRRLLDLHERERQLIAYEIHDGFAQQLTGALLRLQAFREALANNPVEAWIGFDSASQLISRAIDETRRLISGLRPPVLDELGIVEAIQYLVYEFRKNDGLEIEFEHNFEYDIARERFVPPLENAIFRVVQESLHNACRHSRSDRIRVELTRNADRIYIDIRDWGIGFDPSVVEQRRFGLQGIRERVRLLDGCASIESAPGKGTRISVELPLVGMECAPSSRNDRHR